MNATELRGLISRALGELTSMSGGVLYSGLDTLTKGDFYVLGINPGGTPSDTDTTIGDEVPHERDWSAYTQACWQDDAGGCTHKVNGRVLDKFLTRYQRGVLALFHTLGRRSETVFSTNCVFARSKKLKDFQNVSDLPFVDWEGACWPVHQALLDEVRPRWIISLGFGAPSSAFGLWRKRSGNPDWQEVGHGKGAGWKYKATFDLGQGRSPLETQVLGVPHPSRHAIGESLQEFIRTTVANQH